MLQAKQDSGLWSPPDRRPQPQTRTARAAPANAVPADAPRAAARRLVSTGSRNRHRRKREPTLNLLGARNQSIGTAAPTPGSMNRAASHPSTARAAAATVHRQASRAAGTASILPHPVAVSLQCPIAAKWLSRALDCAIWASSNCRSARRHSAAQGGRIRLPNARPVFARRPRATGRLPVSTRLWSPIDATSGAAGGKFTICVRDLVVDFDDRGVLGRESLQQARSLAPQLGQPDLETSRLCSRGVGPLAVGTQLSITRGLVLGQSCFGKRIGRNAGERNCRAGLATGLLAPQRWAVASPSVRQISALLPKCAKASSQGLACSIARSQIAPLPAANARPSAMPAASHRRPAASCPSGGSKI